MATILLIDNDDGERLILQAMLQQAGHHVLTAESGKIAFRLLEHQVVDLVLVDIFMPEMDGLEVTQQLCKTRPACKIIAISGGEGERDYLHIVKLLGAHDCLRKPFHPQALLDAIAAQVRSPETL